MFEAFFREEGDGVVGLELEIPDSYVGYEVLNMYVWMRRLLKDI
jgi:hypothetical protein